MYKKFERKNENLEHPLNNFEELHFYTMKK